MENADIKIGLMHHPPASEWFTDSEQHLQRAKMNNFDFVLRGHEHDAEFLGINRGLGEWQQIASGALYTHPLNPRVSMRCAWTWTKAGPLCICGGTSTNNTNGTSTLSAAHRRER